MKTRRPANPYRGETVFSAGETTHVLRPTFEALVATEQTVGPLIGLARRTARDGPTLDEMAALFHHCARAADANAPPPETFGNLIIAEGLAQALPVYRALLEAALGGGGRDHDGGG